MAQTYTLEEAANRLGISPEEMKRKLKTDWTHVRSFRDGPTLRFRANDVDELARGLGAASDPGLQLAPMPGAPNPGSDDFKVSDTPAAKAGSDEPLNLSMSTSDDDIFSLSAEEPKGGSKPGKHDSDVRLGAQSSGKLKPGKKEGDPASVPTEEISLDLGGPGSAVIKGGSSAKLSAPKSSGKLTGGTGDSGKNLANPGAGESSEFELSLDADSSDFELQLNADSSDEVALGELPKEKGGSSRGGGSGINLRSPGDSGISLEKNKGAAKPPAQTPAETDADSEFELSLEMPSPAGKLGVPKSGKLEQPPPDSDSEFELTLDDSGEGSSLEAAALESAEGEHKDIFETDFEIPPMEDSGSEAVALESDTDLAIDEVEAAPDDETGSEVVVLEDEEVAAATARKGPKSFKGRKAADVEAGDVDLADVEVEDEDDAASALRGARKRHADEEDEEEQEKVVVVAQPAPWGWVPAVLLFPAMIFVLLGGLMGYELLHTMWSYQQTKKPTAPLTREVAKILEMEVRDQ
jgi:hypothetical protein